MDKRFQRPQINHRTQRAPLSKGGGNMLPAGPHLDQLVPPRWMIVQEGSSSGKLRGHSNLKARAPYSTYGRVQPLCGFKTPFECSVLGLLVRWKMETRPVLIAQQNAVSLKKPWGSISSPGDTVYVLHTSQSWCRSSNKFHKFTTKETSLHTTQIHRIQWLPLSRMMRDSCCGLLFSRDKNSVLSVGEKWIAPNTNIH